MVARNTYEIPSTTAGAGGGVISNRLTESPHTKVLMIEAGSRYWIIFYAIISSLMPLGLAILITQTLKFRDLREDWKILNLCVVLLINLMALDYGQMMTGLELHHNQSIRTE